MFYIALPFVNLAQFIVCPEGFFADCLPRTNRRARVPILMILAREEGGREAYNAKMKLAKKC